MAQEAVRAISPVGRIIWGSVSERAAKDYDGKDYPPNEGPIQFGLAIRKDDPGVMAFLGAIYQTAMGGYPNNPQMAARIQNEWQSGFAGLNFRFKVKDGDKPDAKGRMNENSKGCWVFSMSTTIPFKCGNAQNQEIDPKLIERGYYVDVAVSLKVNGNVDGTAGIYLNPNVVRLIAYGEKIVGGISVEDAFAGHAAPTQLPPGASLTPLAPTGGMPQMPSVGGYPQPGFTGSPAPMTGSPAAQQMPSGLPATGPVAASPSNQMPGQMPAGFQPGAFQQPQNAPSPTGYPINPQTGQPIQPNNGFVMPGMPGQR